MFYTDFSTGEVIECPVLVCVLPASGYTYVEALASSRSDDLFGGLNRCLEYLGGAPRNVLSDNMRQYVVKNSRYEHSFTELAMQWSALLQNKPSSHTSLSTMRLCKQKRYVNY